MKIDKKRPNSELNFPRVIHRHSHWSERRFCIQAGHYRVLNFSVSSTTISKRCLAFLLKCEPVPQLTRLVSCFVEYSCNNIAIHKCKFVQCGHVYHHSQTRLEGIAQQV